MEEKKKKRKNEVYIFLRFYFGIREGIEVKEKKMGRKMSNNFCTINFCRRGS